MQFQEFIFTNDKMTYIAPTWEEMNQLAFSVAQQVVESEWKPDRVVTLAKGGWAMTRSLVDYLGVSHVASIGVKFYSGINERMEEPEVYQDLPIDISRERILLFDDVADSGKSLEFVRDLLLKRGAAEVRTATLFYKPHSVLRPEYFAAQTTAWIVFQYEFMEMAKMLVPKWEGQGADKAEVQDRLQQLGFSPELLDFYYTVA